jgi:hypothetical protein
LFGWLLRVYPAAYRDQFGTQMLTTFADALDAERASGTVARFLAREYFGVLASGLSIRFSEPPAMSAGTLLALALHILLYTLLVPVALKAEESDFRALYDRTLAALAAAKSDDDLRRATEMLDASQWLGFDAAGVPLTRAQAAMGLRALLTLPPNARVPRIEIVWTNESPASAVVVAWVTQSVTTGQDTTVVGTLVRDTFARTSEGWRRVRHEKILPNRPLATGGKALFLPPLR